MDDSIKELLKMFDIGPGAVAVITLLVAVAPKLLAVATDRNEKHRDKINNKDYLQILKMRCEIQALINNNNLDRNSFALPPLPGLVLPSPPAYLSRREKFMSTFLGAISPIGLFISYSAFESRETGYDFLLAMMEIGLGLLFLSLLVGSVSLVTPLRRAWHAYIFGVSIPIVLILIFNVLVSKGLGSSGGWGF
jgi:hypothetical protein